MNKNNMNGLKTKDLITIGVFWNYGLIFYPNVNYLKLLF